MIKIIFSIYVTDNKYIKIRKLPENGYLILKIIFDLAIGITSLNFLTTSNA